MKNRGALHYWQKSLNPIGEEISEEPARSSLDFVLFLIKSNVRLEKQQQMRGRKKISLEKHSDTLSLFSLINWSPFVSLWWAVGLSEKRTNCTFCFWLNPISGLKSNNRWERGKELSLEKNTQTHFLSSLWSTGHRLSVFDEQEVYLRSTPFVLLIRLFFIKSNIRLEKQQQMRGR